MKIIEANQDLGERLESEDVDLRYDRAFDILLVTIGKPIEAITETLRDGLQLRLHPESLKISAFEVLGFRRRFLKAHPEHGRDFAFLFEADHEPATTEGRKAAQHLAPMLS